MSWPGTLILGTSGGWGGNSSVSVLITGIRNDADTALKDERKDEESVN